MTKITTTFTAEELPALSAVCTQMGQGCGSEKCKGRGSCTPYHAIKKAVLYYHDMEVLGNFERHVERRAKDIISGNRHEREAKQDNRRKDLEQVVREY